MKKPTPNHEEYLDFVGQKLNIGDFVVWFYEHKICIVHSFSGSKVRVVCYNSEIDEFENNIKLANEYRLIKVSSTDIDGIYIDAKERMLNGTNTGI